MDEDVCDNPVEHETKQQWTLDTWHLTRSKDEERKWTDSLGLDKCLWEPAVQTLQNHWIKCQIC